MVSRLINRSFSDLACSTILIGKTGENEVTEITIDVSEEMEKYPTATFEMLLVSPADQDAPYPVVTDLDHDGDVSWVSYVISGYDLREAGYGKLELIMRGVDGEVLKSSIAKTRIDSSLLNGNVYPESVQKWVDFFRSQRSAIRVVDDFPTEARYGELVYVTGAPFSSNDYGLYINVNPDPDSDTATWESIFTIGDRRDLYNLTHRYYHSHLNEDVLNELSKDPVTNALLFNNVPVAGNGSSDSTIRMVDALPVSSDSNEIVYLRDVGLYINRGANDDPNWVCISDDNIARNAGAFVNWLHWHENFNVLNQLTQFHLDAIHQHQNGAVLSDVGENEDEELTYKGRRVTSFSDEQESVLNKFSEENGVPRYNGHSIYSYIRDFLSTIMVDGDELHVDTTTGLAWVDENGRLFIDDSVIKINNDEMEVFA